MKIAVVGARIYPNPEDVKRFVRSLPPNWEIVSGGCLGVDTWAVEAAIEAGMPYTVFAADWDRVGKAAGMLRNTQIANACDACVGFIEGNADGTMDTVKKVVSRRRPVWVVDSTEKPPTAKEIVVTVSRFSSTD